MSIWTRFWLRDSDKQCVYHGYSDKEWFAVVLYVVLTTE